MSYSLDQILTIIFCVFAFIVVGRGMAKELKRVYGSKK